MAEQYTNPARIPPLYEKAETSLPQVDVWCSTVLSGASARLLIFGPFRSGKTHTGYAALRRLLAAGYPNENLGVYRTYDLANHYQPHVIEHGPPVIFLDNLTDRSDNLVGVKNLEPDEPEIEALMALQQGAVVDAAERLASRANASWIACASNEDRLRQDLGAGVARKLLSVAEVVTLPPRPRRGPVLDW